MDECFTVNSKDKGLFETLLPLLRKTHKWGLDPSSEFYTVTFGHCHVPESAVWVYSCLCDVTGTGKSRCLLIFSFWQYWKLSFSQVKCTHSTLQIVLCYTVLMWLILLLFCCGYPGATCIDPMLINLLLEEREVISVLPENTVIQRDASTEDCW